MRWSNSFNYSSSLKMERSSLYKNLTAARQNAARYAPYSKPQPRNPEQGGQDKLETADKSRYILRYSWPINRSGTKEIVLGADPDFEFKPTITFRKPGFPGVRLSPEGSLTFLAKKHILANYFNGNIAECEKIMLSEKEEVQGTVVYGKKAITIRITLGEQTYCFIMNQQTWNFYESLSPLVEGYVGQYATHYKVFGKFIERFKKMLHEATGGKMDAAHIRPLLDAMTIDDFEFQEELGMDIVADYIRTFYELKQFCLKEILAL
jgi:hypothetical protein